MRKGAKRIVETRQRLSGRTKGEDSEPTRSLPPVRVLKVGRHRCGQCTESFKVSFERGSTAKPLMIKLVLAATAFSLAETALLLSSFQERMYDTRDGRRTTILRFDLSKATPR
jgi:hypothetical protein